MNRSDADQRAFSDTLRGTDVCRQTWQTAAVESSGPGWYLLVRDLSDIIPVEGVPVLYGCMIVDRDTGLVRSVSMGESIRRASGEAIKAALTASIGSLEPGVPDEVVCAPEYAADVARELKRLVKPNPAAPVRKAQPPDEAEEFFEALLGKLHGRRQPDEPPRPADWRLLVTVSGRYADAEPWSQRTDSEVLDLELQVDGEKSEYVAVVIGYEGLQEGLALYPGRELPADLVAWDDDDQVPFTPGSLLFHLNDPDEAPPDMLAKAVRYGWPADAKSQPLWVALGRDGLVDLDRSQVRRLTVAVMSVLDHEVRRRQNRRIRRTEGSCALTDGELGRFVIREHVRH